MAITTLDGIIAGAQPPEEFLKVMGATSEAAGVMHSLFYQTGRPGAAAQPAPGMAGAALTSYAGQIPYTNPGAGNAYLMRFCASSLIAGCLLLVDRLWHNSGIAVTTTTVQTINSVAWPARDKLGAINGNGVLVGIEVYTATTNASAVTNTVMSYTNPSDASPLTATIASFPATAVAGTFVPFQLAAGDVGVKSIQTITLGTSYGAGAIHLVAYRVLARLELPLVNTGNALDAITGGFPRLYDNTVPQLIWLPAATTVANIAGQMIVTHG